MSFVDRELRLSTWCAVRSPVRARGALLIVLTSSALACGPAAGGGAGAGGAAGSTDTGGAGGPGGDAGTGGAIGGAGGSGGASGDGAAGGAAGATGGAAGTIAGAGGDAGGGGLAAGGTGSGDAGTGTATGDAAVDAPTIPALRTAADTAGLLIGAAVSSTHLPEAAYASTAAAQMNFLTPENEMKWDATEASPNVFTFDQADAVVAFAGQNGMQVKGHTLVWYGQLPAWVTAIQDADQLRTAMVNHITQVALHFRGKVIAWDVVNEGMADSGQLRNDVFMQLMGARYIDDAFIAAHAADPYARLYYNDYGAEGAGAKSDAVYTLVQGMLARGVPIHGVGLQMHTGPTDVSPSAAELASNMQRLAALGLDVMITEMDVQICNSDPDTQGRRFHDIVAACKAQPFCRAVTVWGIPDKYSWRNGQTCATPKPLLFDDNYQAKPAHNGVLHALLGL